MTEKCNQGDGQVNADNQRKQLIDEMRHRQEVGKKWVWSVSQRERQQTALLDLEKKGVGTALILAVVLARPTIWSLKSGLLKTILMQVRDASPICIKTVKEVLRRKKEKRKLSNPKTEWVMQIHHWCNLNKKFTADSIFRAVMADTSVFSLNTRRLIPRLEKKRIG